MMDVPSESTPHCAIPFNCGMRTSECGLKNPSNSAIRTPQSALHSLRTPHSEVAVVDYGMGNLRSVAKALERVGAKVSVTSDPDEIRASRKIVLPGVGAFADAVKELKSRDLWDLLKGEIERGKPYLGICLGLQLLFTVSFEDGEHSGMGLLPGKVIRFPEPAPDVTSGPRLKVPHIGWNQIHRLREPPLLVDVPEGSYFYFVHSYYVLPDDSQVTAATTRYGTDFVSMVWRQNLFGTQFHPEKSQKWGLKIMENFHRL